jgi:hypothetical protein
MFGHKKQVSLKAYNGYIRKCDLLLTKKHPLFAEWVL